VHQHGAGGSGGLPRKAGPKKDAERRDKVSIRTGKETQHKAELVKTFQDAGDVKNDTAVM
jgi:hypothetical protein